MTFEEAYKRVEEEIAQLQVVKAPERLYLPIEYTLCSGGKRLRPSLCLMACSALGGPIEQAIAPALGLEIFHNFTLLHDDLMDNDEVRRGHLTVHKKWDENTAILSGDAMQILAYKFIAKTQQDHLVDVLSVFSDTALKVCEGQQYDMDFEQRSDVSVIEYIEMIECKTAVLIEASLKLGAIVSGASQEQVALFGQFGSNLGLAFQLRDDWLDTFGDIAIFGKDIGSDIINNKKTYLLISALQQAKGADKLRLEALLAPDCTIAPQEKVDEVKALFTKLGIDVLTQNKAEDYYRQAVQALDMLEIDNKQDFIDLAQRMLKRYN